MNSIKKFFSSVLAALMIAGCGTLTFARNFDDITEDNEAKTEISILTDLGVIKGTDENEFSPEEDVSREQMATFLFRLMLGRDDAGRVNTTSFRDLYEPYYNGAISWANAAGYIIGTSKITFEPKGGILKQDAMTMLVRALGQDNEKMNAGYPWSYINAGIKLGLDRGLADVAYDETLTRAETAVMLYNALTAEYLVDRTTSSGSIYYESTSIIEEVFGYSIAEAVLVSTNDYTLEDSTVVKNGHVTFKCTNDEGSFYITAPYSDLGLDGSENEYLGVSFKLIYSAEAGRYTVLSAVETSETEEYTTVKIDGGRVVIGDNKYTLVSEYSDELSTNNHELKLYAFDADGQLELIDTTAELSELLGFYRVSLIFEDNSDVAKRGIIKVFEMDVLNIDENGKINIAGGKTAEQIEVTNTAEAKSGDYVLYYYNASVGELEIAEALEIVSGTVKRITQTGVKIGDTTLALGNAVAGISAESIRQKLELGESASVVVYNGAAVAVVEGTYTSDASQYLLALSDAHRVYENGSFRYVMSAYIDGKEEHIYVKNSDAVEGEIYRYTETAGTYSLTAAKVEDGIIISGAKEFIQNSNGLDEIGYIIESANGTTIELGGRNYYTMNRGDAESIASVAGLSNVKFVFDSDTVIVVNDGGVIMHRDGVYNSSIHVNDGAKIVAVFDNEVGSVETLKFLYISDGELGNYDLDAEFVRVLAENGYVYENGVSYVEYIVYNFETGKIETKLSRHSELEVGEDYRCGNDDTVTDEKAEFVVSGFVTGYTDGTVTVDGTTFSLASDAKIIRIGADYKVTAVSVADLYMRNIEFVTSQGEVKLIIEGEAATFTAEAAENTVTVTPDFDLSEFADSTPSVTSLKKGETEVELTGSSVEFGEENTVEVTLAEALTEGSYKLTFVIGGKTFSVTFTVSAAE